MKRKKTFTVQKLLFKIFIFLGVIVLITLLKPNKTPNSFKNAGYLGNSLYYDTLKKLDYDISYELNAIKDIQTEGLVVLNTASAMYQLSETDYERIFDYVKSGGKMLVLSSNSIMEDGLTPPPEGFEPVLNEIVGQPFEKWVTDDEGVLMYGAVNLMSNIFVSTDRETTYRTLQMIHPYIVDEGIVFNEHYIYVTGGNRSLWREMPQGMKFTLIQMLIAFLFFVWYKGKRFGAPLKLYEEVEPDENQYPKAVGALYYKAGHWEVLLDAYYHQLVNRICRKYLLYKDVGEENWISVFETSKDKEYKMAKKVQSFMKDYHAGTLTMHSKRAMKKSIKEILIAIQNLEKSLE